MLLSRRTILGAATALAAGPAGAQASAMKIGVIGAGSLGGTVGRIWVRAGHEVFFSSLNPAELLPMTRALGARAHAGTAREAAAFGSVLLFAVPYDALEQLGRELAASMRGKIVLDACNPRGGTAAETPGVAQTSARLLAGGRYVRVFSAVDAVAIEASAAGRRARLGVPLASDDAEAARTAETLVRDAGCDPVMVGGLAAARAFQRGGPGFRANTTAPELRRLLGL